MVSAQMDDELGKENASATAATPDTPVKPTEFTCFPSLPIELRLKIWKMALPAQRYIEFSTITSVTTPNTRIKNIGTTFRCTDRGLGMSLANHESREVLLKDYILIGGSWDDETRRPRPARLYYNPAVDIIVAGTGPEEPVWVDNAMIRLAIAASQWKPKGQAMIQRIALRDTSAWRLITLALRRRPHLPATNMLSGLKQILIFRSDFLRTGPCFGGHVVKTRPDVLPASLFDLTGVQTDYWAVMLLEDYLRNNHQREAESQPTIDLVELLPDKELPLDMQALRLSSETGARNSDCGWPPEKIAWN